MRKEASIEQWKTLYEAGTRIKDLKPWKKFYQYQLTVTNWGTEEVSSWEISVSFSEDIILSDGWNGEYTEKGKKLTIHSKDYNGAVEAGEAASEIGFIVSASKAPLLQ